LGVELEAGAGEAGVVDELEELPAGELAEDSAGFPLSLLSAGFDSFDDSAEVLSELFGA